LESMKLKLSHYNIGKHWAMEFERLEHAMGSEFVGFSNEENSIYEIQNGHAIINFKGIFFGEENIYTKFGMGTSGEFLQSALELASDDRHVEKIVLVVDSPGGEVYGTQETAMAVKKASEKKPVIAYVSDMAASAAYWIISQATTIAISETSCVGSVGVRAVYEFNESDNVKRYSYLSSQSPLKDFNPRNKEFVDDLQKNLDYLCSIFIREVAEGRNVSIDKVETDFGRGGLVYGQEAIDRGMADRLTTFKSILIKEKKLDSEIVAQERQRVANILAIPTETHEEKAILEKGIIEGLEAGAVGIKILEHRKTSNAQKLKEREKDAQEIPVVSSVSEEVNEDEVWIKKMAMAYNQGAA
jgi:ClpP class serine protease